MSITGETLTYSTETLTKRSPYQREKDRRPPVLFLASRMPPGTPYAKINEYFYCGKKVRNGFVFSETGS